MRFISWLIVIALIIFAVKLYVPTENTSPERTPTTTQTTEVITSYSGEAGKLLDQVFRPLDRKSPDTTSAIAALMGRARSDLGKSKSQRHAGRIIVELGQRLLDANKVREDYEEQPERLRRKNFNTVTSEKVSVSLDNKSFFIGDLQRHWNNYVREQRPPCMNLLQELEDVENLR